MRGATVLIVVSSLATAAWAQPSELDKAKAYFQAGVDAYDRGEYAIARDEFAHAHALSHSPALYFNMVACEEHLDHFQAAAGLLRQYVIEKPDAEDRDKIEQRITSLDDRDAQLHHPAPPELAKTPPPAPVAAAPKRKLTLTWLGLGITGAAGLTTIGVGAYTVTHHNDLKSSCGATSAGCTSGQIDSLKSAANATDALIAVTAVAAVATVIAAVVETRRARSHAARTQMIAFDGAGARF